MKKILVSSLVLLSVAALGCNKQKDAESSEDVEDQVEEAAEDTEDALDEAADDTEDAIDEAAEETHDELDGNPATE